MSYFEGNTGNIKAQIGASLVSIRQATDQGDVGKVADHINLLVSMMAPKLRNWMDYEIPDIDPNASDASDRQAFKVCRRILAEVLCELSGQGFYAFADVEPEDAGDMALGSDSIPDE